MIPKIIAVMLTGTTGTLMVLSFFSLKEGAPPLFIVPLYIILFYPLFGFMIYFSLFKVHYMEYNVVDRFWSMLFPCINILCGAVHLCDFLDQVEKKDIEFRGKKEWFIYLPFLLLLGVFFI
jgi:hypothetical protein